MMDKGDYVEKEKELKRERKFLRNVMATIPDFMLILDRELRIKNANRSFYEFFQTEPEKTIGRKLADILGDEDGTLSAELNRLFGTEDMLENFELHYQSDKLGERILNIRARGMIVEEEEEEELVVIQDITERKRAEEALRESEERYRDLYENAPVAYFSADTRGILRECNKAAHLWLGYSSGELLGKNRLQLYAEESRAKAKLTFEKFKRGAVIQDEEMTFVRKDGQKVYGIRSISPITDEDGRVIASRTVVKDTTERKAAEDALAASKAYTESIIQNFLDTLIVVDTEAKIQTVNPATCHLLGYTEEELFRQPIGILFAEEEEEEVRRVFQFFRQRETVETLRPQDNIRNRALTYKSKDGRLIPMLFNASVVVDEGGSVTAVVAGAKDITELKLAEETLKKSEEKYRSLVNNISLGIFRSTPEPTGRFLEVNPAMERITGYSREELLRMDVSNLYLHPEEREAVLEEITSATGMTTRELQIRKKDGTEIIVFDAKIPVRNDAGQIMYFDGILEDIAERKKAEERLRTAEQNFRNSLDNSPLGVRIVTADGELLYANKAILDTYGYSNAEELRETSTKRRYTPESYVEHQMRKEKRLRGEYVPSNYEISIVRKDSEIRHLEVLRKEVLWDGQTQFQVLYNDITERKRAEREIKREKAFSANIVATVPESLLVVDRDSRIKSTNRAFNELFQTEPEKVMGRKIADVLGDKDGKLGAQLARLFGTEDTLEDFELHHQSEKLGERILNITARGMIVAEEEEEEEEELVVIQDITERKKMQEQLMAQDRLASIGQLVSGVAHEVNNPLTGVIGFSELLLKRDLPDDVKADLKVVNDEAMRTARIVKNLLTFARKQPEGKAPVDINEQIQRVLELRDHEQKVNNINVDTHFASDLPKIIGNASQLQQVFFNIVINAEFFMLEAHQKGNLTITTERTGDSVCCSFADDGPGISEEHLRNLFTPFFTTKEVGKGTGLGLSICYGIITEHGGRIYAESKPGKGATFIVELPIKEATTSQEVAE